MKLWKIILIVLLLAALAAGAGYRFYPRNSSPPPIPSSQIAEVRTGTVQLTVNASGAVSLPRQAKLTFGSSAVVSSVTVRTGDRVQKGQVLAKLDTADLERSLARAEDDLRLAQERQRIGYSLADLARSQATVDSAKASLAKAEADLNAITLDRASAQAVVDSAKANLVKTEADLNASVLDRSSAQAAVDNAKASLASAQANMDASALDRASAQAALEQAQQNLEALQKRAPLDIWTAENEERKASDAYLNVAKQTTVSQATIIAQAASPIEVAWQNWEMARLQFVVAKQNVTNAVTDAQNAVARAQDNLNKLMPGGVTILQREAAVATAKASLARAEDDLTRLLPGGATIPQREAAVAGAKASLALAQDDLAKLMPGGATMQQLEAAVAAAKASLTRAQEDLASMKAGASSQYDQLSQQVSISKLQSQVADAKYNLAKATIVAPYDGTVNDVSIKEGDTVSGSATAIVLIDTSVKEVVATVDEVDVAQLSLGQQANITFDALSGLTVPGRVVALAPDAKVQSGVVSYSVTVALISPDTATSTAQPGGAQTPGGTARQRGSASGASGAPSTGATPGQGGATSGARTRAQGVTVGYDSLKGGMTALAQIVTQQKDDVLLVPVKAIKTSGRDRTVQVVLPSGLTETRKVTIGLSDGQNTEITEGLSLGEKVLLPATTSSAARTGSTTQQPAKMPAGIPRF